MMGGGARRNEKREKEACMRWENTKRKLISARQRKERRKRNKEKEDIVRPTGMGWGMDGW